MAFLAPKLTEAGKEIYYQNMAGKQMKFKAIKLGSGEISGPDEIPGLTDLKQPVIDIPAVVTKRKGYVEISGSFSNAQLGGFRWKEIGVMVEDPNDPDRDILYCYQNAYDTADYIPAASEETVEKNVVVPVVVGDVDAVKCELERSLIYVTIKELEENYYTKGETLSPETRVLLGDVNTPDEAFLALYGMAGSIVEMPPAVEPGGRRDGTYYLDRKVSYNRGV